MVRGEEAQSDLGRWERGPGRSLGWSFQKELHPEPRGHTLGLRIRVWLFRNTCYAGVCP